MTTAISPERMAAYEAATFTVHDRRTAIISTNDTSQLIGLLLDHIPTPARTVTILTAANPRGEKTDDERNAAAHSRLWNIVSRLDNHHCPAEGGSGMWGMEAGFAVFNLDIDHAKAIGREFGQDAIAVGTLDGEFAIVPLR